MQLQTRISASRKCHRRPPRVVQRIGECSQRAGRTISRPHRRQDIPVFHPATAGVLPERKARRRRKGAVRRVTRCWFHCATTRHTSCCRRSRAWPSARRCISTRGLERVSRWWCCSAAASSAGCARCATAASSSTPHRPHRIGSPGLHRTARRGTASWRRPLPSPVNGLPVLWYRIQREERKGTNGSSPIPTRANRPSCSMTDRGTAQWIPKAPKCWSPARTFSERSRPAHHPVGPDQARSDLRHRRICHHRQHQRRHRHRQAGPRTAGRLEARPLAPARALRSRRQR